MDLSGVSFGLKRQRGSQSSGYGCGERGAGGLMSWAIGRCLPSLGRICDEPISQFIINPFALGMA